MHELLQQRQQYEGDWCRLGQARFPFCCAAHDVGEDARSANANWLHGSAAAKHTRRSQDIFSEAR